MIWNTTEPPENVPILYRLKASAKFNLPAFLGRNRNGDLFGLDGVHTGFLSYDINGWILLSEVLDAIRSRK